MIENSLSSIGFHYCTIKNIKEKLFYSLKVSSSACCTASTRVLQAL